MAVKDSSYYQSAEFRKRVQKMFIGDCIFAIIFLIVLWATYTFVYVMITPLESFSTTSQIWLTIGGLMVCVFNSAGVIFLIRYFTQNKELVYNVDLRHLDSYRAAKKKRK